jgi:3-oxoadipate enol-lactonase
VKTELGLFVRRVNGTVLSYLDTGVGLTPLLLVHGHPFNHTMWAPQIGAFRRECRVIAPDLRGYGRSPLPDQHGETHLEVFAADCLALLDALGVQQFLLGGLSMGGQIVLEIMRQASSRVLGLVLADTFADLDTPERKQWRMITADRLEREGMGTYAKEELFKMITPANARQHPALAAHVMEMMTTTPPRGAAAALRGRAKRIDYVPTLANIKVPTLIVVGREDVYTPVAIAEQLHKSITGSALAIIEEAGHMPNLERPTEFNHALEQFFATVRGHGGKEAQRGPGNLNSARNQAF